MTPYCYGILAVFGGITLIVVILLAIAPEGYEDEDGYHGAKDE